MSDTAQALLGRLTWASSYSASEVLVASSALPGRLLIALTPLFACGVARFQRLEGLQALCAILAAQGLTACFPIPYEPVGHLVLPTALLYFAVVATVGWFVCRVIAPTLDGVMDQFVALFATARALLFFRGANQTAEIGALSFAFLCIPHIPYSADLPIDAWARQMLRVIECFASRASATWIAAQCDAWAPQGAPLMGLYAVILLFFPGDFNPKLAALRSVVALLCAQRAVVWLPYPEPFVAALVALPHPRFREVAVLATSILAAKRLEAWIAACGRAEGACAYMTVFVLLQLLTTAMAPPKPPTTVPLLPTTDSGVPSLWF